jgi:hypothetical protein
VFGQPCGKGGIIAHRGAAEFACCLCNLGHFGSLLWWSVGFVHTAAAAS